MRPTATYINGDELGNPFLPMLLQFWQAETHQQQAIAQQIADAAAARAQAEQHQQRTERAIADTQRRAELINERDEGEALEKNYHRQLQYLEEHKLPTLHERRRRYGRKLPNTIAIRDTKKEIKDLKAKYAAWVKRKPEIAKDMAGLTTFQGELSGSVPSRLYRVKLGDTYSKLAMRFYRNGKLWPVIWAANVAHFAKPEDLRAGVYIDIPIRKGMHWPGTSTKKPKPIPVKPKPAPQPKPQPAPRPDPVPPVPPVIDPPVPQQETDDGLSTPWIIAGAAVAVIGGAILIYPLVRSKPKPQRKATRKTTRRKKR